MKIVWDEPKRLANLDKHGMDFGDLAPEFFDDAAVVSGKADRLIAVGRLGASYVTVIFAPLGTGAVSIVSMRAASRKEKRLL